MMSTYRAKRIQIQTSFINAITGKQWLNIGRPDVKTKKHKFSQYDMECNAFNASINIFTGYINVAYINPHYGRLRAFRKNNTITVKANLCHN